MLPNLLGDMLSSVDEANGGYVNGDKLSYSKIYEIECKMREVR